MIQKYSFVLWRLKLANLLFQRAFLGIIVCLNFFGNATAQKTEKDIENETLLIDAIKEEQIGNPEKAISILEKLRFESGVKSTANYQLSKIYAKENRLEEALTSIDIAVSEDPTNKWFLVFKANLLERSGRNEQVAGCYQTLIQLEPNNYTFYENAAIFWVKAEKIDKALQIFNSAQEKFGPFPALILRKVDLLLLMNKTKLALDALQQSIQVYSKHPELYLALADIHSKMNNLSGVENALEQLQKVDPQNPALKKWNAKKTEAFSSEFLVSKLKSGEWNLDEAMQSLIPEMEQDLDQSPPKNIPLYLECAQQMIALYPTDPKPHALLGDIYFKMNEFHKAIDPYRKSIAVSDVPYTVYDHLLFALNQLNHWKSLEHYSKMAQDIYPNSSYPYYTQAHSLFQQGRLDESLDPVSQYLHMNRRSDSKRIMGLMLSARLQSALSNFENSDKLWTEATNINISSNPASVEMYLDQLRSGKNISTSAMESELKKIQAPDYYQSRILAETYFINGDHQAALAQINRCLQSPWGKNIEVFRLAIQVAQKKGDLTLVRSLAAEAMPYAEESKEFENILNGIK